MVGEVEEGREERGKGVGQGWKEEEETYWIEEIRQGDEGEVEDGPDDVEFPAEGGDAWGCDFDLK